MKLFALVPQARSIPERRHGRKGEAALGADRNGASQVPIIERRSSPYRQRVAKRWRPASPQWSPEEGAVKKRHVR